MLPPVRFTIAGRGGALFPLELLAPLAALVVLWRQRFRLRSVPSLTALLLFLALSLPSTLVATDHARHLYGFLLFGMAALLLYVSGVSRLEPALLHDLVRLAPVPFVILALIVLGSAGAQGLLVYSGQRKIELGYGGSNFLASMLLLGAYAPLGLAIGGSRRRGRLLGLVAFAAIAAAIVATGSRLAMGLFPVGSVLTLALWRRRRRGSAARVAAAALVLGLVLLLLTPTWSGMLRYGRFRDPLAQRNWLVRIVLFELTWEQFLASPWVGNGFFNGRVSPVLSALGEGTREGWGAHVSAHNWLLQSLADGGVLGAAAFVAFLAVAGRTFVEGWRGKHRWLPISTGWLAGFAMVVVHGLFEPNFHGKPFIYLLAVELGLAAQVGRVAPAPPLLELRPGRLGERRCPRRRAWIGAPSAPRPAARPAAF